jgi:hypothetical protein
LQVACGFARDTVRKQGSKPFFFEKKKQKTFIPLHFASRCTLRGCQSGFTAIREKFFGSFFQKRTFFLGLLSIRLVSAFANCRLDQAARAGSSRPLPCHHFGTTGESWWQNRPAIVTQNLRPHGLVLALTCRSK